MANRCAGLDPTWAHLPAPAPTLTAHAAAGHCSRSSPAWLLSPAAAFENEALTSALRASMAPAHAAASSVSYPTTPSSSSTSSASELLSGGHDHDAPAASRGPGPARALLARPAGGRVAKPKRKPRPSRRAQTTYITADPANFRRMVQEITGLHVVPGLSYSSSSCAASASACAAATASSWTAPPQACELPTLDTSSFLLDRAAVAATAAPGREDKNLSGGCSPAMAVAVPAAEDKSLSGGCAPAMAVKVPAAEAEEDDTTALLLELEAMAGVSDIGFFPTLESWGII